MLAYKIKTPGNYPEESSQHSEHDESFKSSIKFLVLYFPHLPCQSLKGETFLLNVSSNNEVPGLILLCNYGLEQKAIVASFCTSCCNHQEFVKRGSD